MNKGIIPFCFCWTLGVGLALLISTTVPAAAPTDSLSMAKTELANYRIGKYVIGTGGVLRTKSSNNFHSATAGQTIVGASKSTNNLLVSGFWGQKAKPTEVIPAEQPSLPTEFALHQNYPNPFNAETIISYDLPVVALVTIEIFNTMGQRIRLVKSQAQGPGQCLVVWDGRDDQGQAMGSGIYFYRIIAQALEHQTNQFQQTQKMILVK